MTKGASFHVLDIVVKDLPAEIRRDEALYSSCVAGAISEEEYLAGLREAGLEQVEVRERFVYDASQLAAFIASELPDSKDGQALCGAASADEAARKIAEALVGKVWSAKFHASKPLR